MSQPKVSNETKLKKEIIGIGLIFLALFVGFILLNNDDAGIIGGFLYKVIVNFFGMNGAWMFALLIALFGISNIFYMDNPLCSSHSLLYMSILFISLLGAIHIYSIDFANFSKAYSLGLQCQGGGIVGGLLVFVLSKAFGYYGVFITLTALIVISLLLLTKTSLKGIFKKFASVFNSIKTYLLNKATSSKNGSEVAAVAQEALVIEQNAGEHRPKTKKGKIKKTVVKNNETTKETAEEEIAEQHDSNIPLQLSLKDITYLLPSLDLLDNIPSKSKKNQQFVREQAQKIEETLKNFKIESRVTRVAIGPTITRYEIQIAAGIKVSRVASLEDDIALSLAVAHIRIEAPIPGKSAIGIEVPNTENNTVHLKEVLTSPDYQESKGNIIVALGLDISGKPIIADICKMPHLLIAGATGSGKSVCINVIINSILFRFSPNSVKFVMIDPKRVELSCYNGLPHLLTPVVTDPKKASSALLWVVQEMDKRYQLLAKQGARDINRYNHIIQSEIEKDKNSNLEALPFIVVVIDELADLMMVASNDVEDAICRIAQMGRAAGIHLVIGTQRPSVDVITGLIKANIPARIAFAVSSAIDSRTILDMSGAEKLLGKGDMLYAAPGMSKPIRVQGAYLSEKEVSKVVKYINDQAEVEYIKEDFPETQKNNSSLSDDNTDDLFNDAVRLVVDNDSASISMIQRRFRVGYARAARIIDQLELHGVVGGFEGSKPRKVFADSEVVRNILGNEE